MLLPRVLWVSAGIGFGVPFASYGVWQSAYAIGLGKILDDWNVRGGPFTSLEAELAAQVFHGNTLPTLFDYVFWDVLWVAIINVPLYMALGSICWTLITHRHQTQLWRFLGAAGIAGLVVPLASYFVWWLVGDLSFVQSIYGLLAPQPIVFRDVITVAIANLPLYAALGALW